MFQRIKLLIRSKRFMINLKKQSNVLEKNNIDSLRIIASDRERITKNDFSVFMEKSLEKGIESIIKRNTYDRIF